MVDSTLVRWEFGVWNVRRFDGVIEDADDARWHGAVEVVQQSAAKEQHHSLPASSLTAVLPRLDPA